MSHEPNPLLKQRRAEQRAFPRMPQGRVNGWKIVIAAVAVGVGLIGFFFWRAHAQASADAKLCRKIDAGTVALIEFVQSSPAPPAGTRRWVERERFLALEKMALCDPDNLPTTPKGVKP